MLYAAQPNALKALDALHRGSGVKLAAGAMAAVAGSLILTTIAFLSYGVQPSVAGAEPEIEVAVAQRNDECRNQTWPYFDSQCLAAGGAPRNVRLIPIVRN